MGDPEGPRLREGDPRRRNKRAIRAYEKLGLQPVGVLRRCARMDDGKWHDELIMDLLAEEMT